jgi:hypothetical protein
MERQFAVMDRRPHWSPVGDAFTLADMNFIPTAYMSTRPERARCSAGTRVLGYLSAIWRRSVQETKPQHSPAPPDGAAARRRRLPPPADRLAVLADPMRRAILRCSLAAEIGRRHCARLPVTARGVAAPALAQ